MNIHRARINALALNGHLPSVVGFQSLLKREVSFRFGPNYPALWRRSAEFVDKILRGAKPADIPVEQPTKFDLVINLKTAKTLGLEIPAIAARPRRRGDRVKRREFITLLGGAAAAWPLAARAQQADRMRRIGVLMGYAESDLEVQAHIAAFREGLQKLGWTEGRNIQIDTRWAAPDDAASMRRFAKELVALQPDVILSNTTPTTTALLQQTRYHPHCFRDRCRPDRQRFCRQLRAAWRQRHRFHLYGTDDGGQVAGTAKGDCTARRPDRDAVQPGIGDICRLLAEPLQSRRSVFCSGGNCRTGTRYVRVGIRHCRTGTRAKWWPYCDAG